MNLSALFRSTAVVALAFFFAVPSGAQSIVGKDKTGPVPSPVALDPAGLFQAKFVSVGDDMFIVGQPTENALRDLRPKGVTTLLNLPMPEGMALDGFEQARLV